MDYHKKSFKITVTQRLLRNAKALFFYTFGFIGIEFATDIYSDSPHIYSQSQLERLLAVEKEELKCQKNIIATLGGTDGSRSGSFSSTVNEVYLIELSERGRNLSVLQHELYHICDGHYENEKKEISLPFLIPQLNYFFWYEPQAAVYAATGLKS